MGDGVMAVVAEKGDEVLSFYLLNWLKETNIQ